MASVYNRVVERAWLDCLQNESKFVKQVIELPTSVGGLPHRSVPHGLKLIHDAFSQKKMYFVRSDISGFFDNIPRAQVLDKIAREIDDQDFLRVLDLATTVVLSNEKTLGEDRRIFPTDDQGVAQGSPLSPLFGNVLLYDFDLEFNKRGIICVRFIDDFILLGDNERDVSRAFQKARQMLEGFGLRCHDPFAKKANAEKAIFGKVENGFVFLGYDIRPGLFQPSRLARQKLERTIDEHISFGRRAISEVKKSGNSFENRQRYVQTLALIDKVLRGWGDAFAYSNSTGTIGDLDKIIDEKLDRFRSWFAGQLRGQDWKTRRRIGGVCLIGDTNPKNLDDVPFRLEAHGRFAQSKNTLTISTDGSIANLGHRRGKDQGPGGWAFVVHETDEQRSGRVASSTNNQMELRAVIEAICFAPPNKSIIIRTDSQYVYSAISGRAVVKTNQELWRKYQEVSKSRRIRVVWVKGHAGDAHNEKADQLANQQALRAQAELPTSAKAA
jgi:RNA-directed DNA polymerase